MRRLVVKGVECVGVPQELSRQLRRGSEMICKPCPLYNPEVQCQRSYSGNEGNPDFCGHSGQPDSIIWWPADKFVAARLGVSVPHA